MPSQTTSLRGVMSADTWRFPRRMTRLSMSCSAASKVPASVPCWMRILSSSSVTGGSMEGLTRSSQSARSEERLSTHDTGAAIQQSTRMGRAVNTAILSGCVRPMRLGTSSPKSSVRKVMASTTSPKPSAFA